MKKIALVLLLILSVSLAKEFPELSIGFNFVPGEIYPTERSIGVFDIVNPQGARPVFDLNITFWAPCNDATYHDFNDVTDWNVDKQSWKDTRIIFSGVLERRVIWSTAGPLQQYAQCLYSFVFQLPPKADGFKGPAVIRPGETIQLNFTLQSTASARFGTYDMSIVSENYIKPGQELAQIVKK
jgi:hypothetical protein